MINNSTCSPWHTVESDLSESPPLNLIDTVDDNGRHSWDRVGTELGQISILDRAQTIYYPHKVPNYPFTAEPEVQSLPYSQPGNPHRST